MGFFTKRKKVKNVLAATSAVSAATPAGPASTPVVPAATPAAAAPINSTLEVHNDEDLHHLHETDLATENDHAILGDADAEELREMIDRKLGSMSQTERKRVAASRLFLKGKSKLQAAERAVLLEKKVVSELFDAIDTDVIRADAVHHKELLRAFHFVFLRRP